MMKVFQDKNFDWYMQLPGISALPVKENETSKEHAVTQKFIINFISKQEIYDRCLSWIIEVSVYLLDIMQFMHYFVFVESNYIYQYLHMSIIHACDYMYWNTHLIPTHAVQFTLTVFFIEGYLIIMYIHDHVFVSLVFFLLHLIINA